jgi:hypothetical protein
LGSVSIAPQCANHIRGRYVVLLHHFQGTELGELLEGDRIGGSQIPPRFFE